MATSFETGGQPIRLAWNNINLKIQTLKYSVPFIRTPKIVKSNNS